MLFYRQAIIEQERRDRELALRLVAEDQNQVEDVTLPPLTRYLHTQFVVYCLMLPPQIRYIHTQFVVHCLVLQQDKYQIISQGSHRLEKYLNIQDCLEKSLKIIFPLKST